MCSPSQAKSPQLCGGISGWDYAISEAEKQISEFEERIIRLRNSIQTFQEMKRDGEPWRVEISESEKPK